jgi:hypothetical protein
VRRATCLALAFLLAVLGCEPKPPKPKTQEIGSGAALHIPNG